MEVEVLGCKSSTWVFQNNHKKPVKIQTFLNLKTKAWVLFYLDSKQWTWSFIKRDVNSLAISKEHEIAVAKELSVAFIKREGGGALNDGVDAWGTREEDSQKKRSNEQSHHLSSLLCGCGCVMRYLPSLSLCLSLSLRRYSVYFVFVLCSLSLSQVPEPWAFIRGK